MTFFHGTSDRAFLNILKTGSIQPACTNPIEGVKQILADYVEPSLITNDLVETVIANGGTALLFNRLQQDKADSQGAVFFYNDLATVLKHGEFGYAGKSFVEEGGEYAAGVFTGLRTATGLDIQPRYAGAKPLILEVDVDATGDNVESWYQGNIDVQHIVKVHLVDDNFQITGSLSLDQAKQHFKELEEKPPMGRLSELGYQSTTNNAFYNAFVQVAPSWMTQKNELGKSAGYFFSAANFSACQLEIPSRDHFLALESIRHYRGQPIMRDVVDGILEVSPESFHPETNGIFFDISREKEGMVNWRALIGNRNNKEFLDKSASYSKYTRRYFIPYESMAGPMSAPLLNLRDEYQAEREQLLKLPFAQRIKTQPPPSQTRRSL